MESRVDHFIMVVKKSHLNADWINLRKGEK